MVNPLELAALAEETLPLAGNIGAKLLADSGIVPKVVSAGSRLLTPAAEVGAEALVQADTGLATKLAHRMPFKFDVSGLPGDRNSPKFQEMVARQLGLDPEKLGSGKVAVLHRRFDTGSPDISFAAAKHEVALWGSQEQGLGVVEYKALAGRRGYLSGSDAVVRVTKTLEGSTVPGQADRASSGVFVKSNGLVATNEHAVRGAQTMHVETLDGNAFTADVVHVDTANDLAILRLNGVSKGSRFPVPEFADPQNLWANARVAAVGHHGGLKGLIASPGKFEGMVGWGKGVYSIDGTFPGASGSPIFAGDGSLVGLVAKINPTVSRRVTGPSADLIRQAIIHNRL